MSGHDHHNHGTHAHEAHDHGGHAHGPGGHHHAPASFGRAFAIGTALNAAFVAAQVFYGLAAHSVALLADAVHNLGDVLGLLIAWGAATLARRAPTLARTYGWGRSTILASLTNAVVLLFGCGAIAVEAVRRFGDPSPVGGSTVMWVAALGIVINGVTALMFMRGRKGDLNVKGAFLHMASDAVLSAGVVVSGLLITLTGWHWLDPATSLAIVAVITIGTWSLLRDSVMVEPVGMRRRHCQPRLVGDRLNRTVPSSDVGGNCTPLPCPVRTGLIVLDRVHRGDDQARQCWRGSPVLEPRHHVIRGLQRALRRRVRHYRSPIVRRAAISRTASVPSASCSSRPQRFTLRNTGP